MPYSPQGLSRRSLLKSGGALAVASFGLQACSPNGGRYTVANDRSTEASFLTEAELLSLSALADRLIPAGIGPGGSATGCADAINILLSAFAFDPPMIFAGGPFSDRGDAAENDFLNFLPLDRYEETAWRLKIEGSQGRPELEFNGPVVGWQRVYQEGLARLNERAAALGFADFASMPAPAQELLMRDSQDLQISQLIDVAFMHCLDAMYGAPEYGGNKDLAAWDFTSYDGDVQPRGYTAEQVTTPDNPGLFDVFLPGSNLPLAPLLPVLDAAQSAQVIQAMQALLFSHSAEMSLGMMLDSQGSWQRVQTIVSGWQGRA